MSKRKKRAQKPKGGTAAKDKGKDKETSPPPPEDKAQPTPATPVTHEDPMMYGVTLAIRRNTFLCRVMTCPDIVSKDVALGRVKLAFHGPDQSAMLAQAMSQICAFYEAKAINIPPGDDLEIYKKAFCMVLRATHHSQPEPDKLWESLQRLGWTDLLISQPTACTRSWQGLIGRETGPSTAPYFLEDSHATSTSRQDLAAGKGDTTPRYQAGPFPPPLQPLDKNSPPVDTSSDDDSDDGDGGQDVMGAPQWEVKALSRALRKASSDYIALQHNHTSLQRKYASLKVKYAAQKKSTRAALKCKEDARGEDQAYRTLIQDALDNHLNHAPLDKGAQVAVAVAVHEYLGSVLLRDGVQEAMLAALQDYQAQAPEAALRTINLAGGGRGNSTQAPTPGATSGTSNLGGSGRGNPVRAAEGHGTVVPSGVTGGHINFTAGGRGIITLGGGGRGTINLGGRGRGIISLGGGGRGTINLGGRGRGASPR